jgi:uncharacterized protein YndB with AHSA1/START domain
MTDSKLWTPDPKLDLVLERDIPVPVAKVWAAWTKPELLKKWFTPRPWETTEVELDLRPGGIFRTVMRSPDGQEHVNLGCCLEVVPESRLVWSDALRAGFRPAPEPFMTAIITFEARGAGTHYMAMARHADESVRKKHEEMGFHEGWGATLEQLVELAKTL